MHLQEGNDTTKGCDRQADARPRGMPDNGQPVAPTASALIAEARHQAADPVIARFRAALKCIQTAELDRLYGRLPDLDEHSRNAIQRFADSLVAKVLHPPLQSLQDESRSGSSRRLLDALERLFQLGD